MDDVPLVIIPPGKKMIVQGLILLGTMMVVLDTTIANVALPHMQAALGASPESISWVLTSYIITSAVATPLTGWLAGRVGRKRLFAIAVAGFTASSALCGIAISLPMMVGARVLQGLCGAIIVPLSQSCMYDCNARGDQVRAMTIWGTGVMVAPILGPLLGGYLTGAFDWRWVFFINVPIGIATAVGMFVLMPEFPSERRPFDKIGFALLVLGLAGLQLVLDRGTQQDWFNSPEILIEAGVSIAGFWMLFFHLRHAANPIIPMAVFKDRNFTTSCVFVFVMGAIVQAGSALLAPMLQALLNYPVLTAGTLVVPRGIGTTLAVLIAGRLTMIADPRIVMATGLSMVVISLKMLTGINLQMGSELIIWSGFLQGLGLGLAMTPVNLLSVSTLQPLLRTEGTAVYSLSRNIGGSVVIAIASALLARNLQVNHSELAATVTTIKMPFLQPGMLESVGIKSGMLVRFIDNEVNRQAMMIAYLDDYWLLMWATICIFPLILLVQPRKPAKGAPIVVGE